MAVHTIGDLLHRDHSTYEVRNGEGFFLRNPRKFAEQTIELLVRDAVFGESAEIRDVARWIIRRGGLELGVVPSSVYELYAARGRGECSGFTVPAFNVRGMSYDMARAIIRAAQRLKVGAFIFELSRTEITYTDQRPAEFAAVMIGSAIRESFQGPIFLLGDHYQVRAKKFLTEDPESEMRTIQDLFRESVTAGYRNIDIDASTLVDLSRREIREQQRLNFEVTAALTTFVRSIEPPGTTIALGGEIGEVGRKNSTPEELCAFIDGYAERLATAGRGRAGLSKVSVQTGTSHGGILLPDGTMAQVAVDFEVLRRLSAMARERYGLAGAVQHGASTLPPHAFYKFVECEVAEVHLATEFQNMMYDDPAFPRDLKEEIYRYLRSAYGDERQPSETDEQFLYRTRKKGFGPFKRQLWDLPVDVRAKIGQNLEDKFAFLFDKLKVVQTADLVKRKVTKVAEVPPAPAALKAVAQATGARS